MIIAPVYTCRMIEFGIYRIKVSVLPSKTLKGLYLRPDGAGRVYVVEEEDGTATGKITDSHLVKEGESVRPVNMDDIGGGILYGRFDKRFQGELEKFKADYVDEFEGVTYFWLRDPDRVVGCIRLSDEREEIRAVGTAQQR
jgi:hypothetical protein